MFEIDAIEVLLGTLGLACSIYDPWISDPRASILVTYARTAALCTLFGLVLLALATLIPSGDIEVDPTIVAIVFFAVGGSAPTLARGAWSLIDMSTMFNDVVWLSYQEQPGVLAGQGRPCNIGAIKFYDFVVWFRVVFCTLMKHNVSFEKLTPYGPNLYRAFRNNWEAVVHGRSINPRKVCWAHAWKWGCGGWASRAKALFNIVFLNSAGLAFLLLQASAVVGEGLLLAVGSVWMSVAIAAQADGLTRDTRVDPRSALKLVVEKLVCCETCTHAGHNHPENDNSKSFEIMMPRVKKKSKNDRQGSSNHTINVCRCRVCKVGCKGGWEDPNPDCHDCVKGVPMGCCRRW